MGPGIVGSLHSKYLYWLLLISPSGSKVLKLIEGLHNKAFIFTMDNGMEVVAKLPNPNAGPARYTTASEVATRTMVWMCFNLEMQNR